MKKWIALLMAFCLLMSTVSVFSEGTDEDEKFKGLLPTLVQDILESAEKGSEIANVDESGMMNIKGGVLAVMVDFLINIREHRSSAEQENGEASEDLMKSRSDLEGLLEMMRGLMSDESKPEREDEPDLESGLKKANLMLTDVYSVMRENSIITEAVDAIGSRLPAILENNAVMLKNYLAEKGTATIAEDFPEAEFWLFEAQCAALRTHILNSDTERKEKAVALLDLLHALMDDIHMVLDGHTHEGGFADADNKELMKYLMNDLLKSASGVYEIALQYGTDEKYDITGSVFHVLENVLQGVLRSRGLISKTRLKQMIEELKAFRGNEKAGEIVEAGREKIMERVGRILDTAFDAAADNEILTKAVQDTGAKIFAIMISHNREGLLNGGFNYAEVEAEMKTLEEHISALEGHGKSKALGILRLIHKMLDDVNEVLGNPS